MNFFKHLTSWLLLLTLLMVGGMANAKVASGVQNLPGGLHQAETTANALWYQAKIDFSYDDASGSPVATKRGDDWAKLSGQLRDAAKGKGNFGIGSGTREQADAMGKAWVGNGYKTASDGKTLVSKDGMRQFRPPSYKPRLDKTQANFEQRFPGQKSNRWQSNGHLDITD